MGGGGGAGGPLCGGSVGVFGAGLLARSLASHRVWFLIIWCAAV